MTRGRCCPGASTLLGQCQCMAMRGHCISTNPCTILAQHAWPNWQQLGTMVVDRVVPRFMHEWMSDCAIFVVNLSHARSSRLPLNSNRVHYMHAYTMPNEHSMVAKIDAVHVHANCWMNELAVLFSSWKFKIRQIKERIRS